MFALVVDLPTSDFENNKDKLLNIMGLYIFQANIMRYSEETLKKMPKSTHPGRESVRSQLSSNLSEKLESLSLKSKDLEMPMPPLALAPLHQEGIR